MRKILMVFLILVVVGGGGYLAYSYGVSKNEVKEVPFGDEWAETDPDYQRAMAEVEDEGLSGEESPWLTYSDEAHKFSFNYPVTVFLEKTEGTRLPRVYMDKELIIIPDGYGGFLTPVEIRTPPLLVEETVAERVAALKDSFDQETYRERELPSHLTGTWMSGTCVVFGCGGQQVEEIVLVGSEGLVSISFLPGREFEEDLFYRILATFKIN